MAVVDSATKLAVPGSAWYRHWYRHCYLETGALFWQA